MINKCIFALTTITVFSTYSAEIEPKKELKQGVLIALEGIPCAGKTTLAANLHSLLKKQGFAAVITRDPNTTELEKVMSSMEQETSTRTSNEALFLLSAANRAHRFATVIDPALKQNKIVISDGFTGSSLAHYAWLRRIDQSSFNSIDKFSREGRKPNYTFYIATDIDITLERCNKRGTVSDYEKKESLVVCDRILKSFYPHCANSLQIDGKQTSEKMATTAYEFLIATLKHDGIILD